LIRVSNDVDQEQATHKVPIFIPDQRTSNLEVIDTNQTCPYLSYCK